MSCYDWKRIRLINMLYWWKYYFRNFLTIVNRHLSFKRIAGVCVDIYIIRQCWQILWRRWGWWQTVIVSVLFLIRSSDQMFCGGNIIGREQQRARSLIKMMRRNTDMIFVQNFTQPDFQAKSFTPQKCVIRDIFLAN